ncbi:hypothetical protein RPC_2398 [Rhodopseudomonas palustris BisB18]|uniref:Uncharacterized protein n=1 Tax=Rhodopseudomonas palustris (strain BisB18) TaxID=316056 RepID=Q215I6_RHOPB
MALRLARRSQPLRRRGDLPSEPRSSGTASARRGQCSGLLARDGRLIASRRDRGLDVAAAPANRRSHHREDDHRERRPSRGRIIGAGRALLVMNCERKAEAFEIHCMT